MEPRGERKITSCRIPIINITERGKSRGKYNNQKKIAWNTNNWPRSKKLLEINKFKKVKKNIDNIGNEILKKCLISSSILKIFKLIYININILNLR